MARSTAIKIEERLMKRIDRDVGISGVGITEEIIHYHTADFEMFHLKEG